MLPRIQKIYEESKEYGVNQPLSTFDYDRNEAALGPFAGLERWEKIARATAYAITAQTVYIRPYDRLIGRIYHLNRKPVDRPDPDFDDHSEALERIQREIPGYDELRRHQLCGGTGRGHITWMWDKILTMGTSGMKALYEEELLRARDEEASQFYRGVLIMLDALEQWNMQHVQELERLGMHEMAAICSRVPEQPAASFHEAVQAFYMQYLVVMRENPYGGNGPGRLDYYLWPYLDRDLQKGAITLDEARELIDELFIRINERIYMGDKWVEAIVVGGSHRNGASSINPLSHIMIHSIMALNITHPSVYVRLPKDAPEDFLNLCASYLKSGENRAQLLSDEQITRALYQHGVTPGDATEYTCGGCMEIGIQGMTSDFLFNGWLNVPKILELCISGGICLKTGGRIGAFSGRSLIDFEDFESFYQYFIGKVGEMLKIFFRAQDIYSEEAQKARPSYLISSMIDDCTLRGRNMHAGGAKYHDYGSAPIGMPNAADALSAIEQAVFLRRLCSADVLMQALAANFEGHEQLQAALKALPKFGQEDAAADAMAGRLVKDICAFYVMDRNRWGGRGKAVVLTFVWATVAGEILGAAADGSPAGKPIAQGVTPQAMGMSKGITAAINSCTNLPFTMLNGGASTMWDMNPDWASEPVIKAVFSTFFNQGGQIFQGNMTDVNELLDAQKNPEEFSSLIVRVGGYSARFVNLTKSLQDEIIDRMRHAG
ncbi:MAG: pyruvate formate lyase family protein [Christensenellales bacterium]|jgi:pyruvate-formate lyase